MDTRVVRRAETAAASAPAGMLTLEIRPDGRLWAVQGGGEDAGPVWVRRSFPWSEPSRFLSLRDDDDQEVALVQEPAELDAASRHALEQAMREAGFVLEVTRVLEIEEEIEIRHWRVETRQGPRSFQTRLDDWPRALPHGGLLIRDVAGDLYLVANPAALDRNSRALLWAFVD
ncbi:MAG: hypothetical protein DMD41_07325 [Gemmatimonadetes bacterium]|nr:MAG: hypothetical protein DMD41_07325 [Gemmatimonadota bacterium]